MDVFTAKQYKIRYNAISIFGMAILLLGLFFVWSSLSMAQDEATAEATADVNADVNADALIMIERGEFIGRGECNDCHRDVDHGYKLSQHDLALFEADDEDYAPFIIGNFTIPSPLLEGITLSDVAYVIGAGKDAQQYVLSNGDGYRLLGATWLTSRGVWQAEGYHNEYPDVTDFAVCADCHTTGYDAESMRWEDDGASCESCHGAGEAHVNAIDDAGRDIDDDELITIRQNIDIDIANQCIACHSDLTISFAQRFISNQLADTAERLAVINSTVSDITPSEMTSEMIETLQADPAIGIHNVAYTKGLLNTIEQALGLQIATVANRNLTTFSNPTECSTCHAEQHAVWLNSSHANATSMTDFQRIFAENGRPTYCLSCHASGYNSSTQTHAFEGVVCENCHGIAEGAEHPPAPYTVATDSEVCGTCHSGGHASAYEEWLVSDHADAGIDCIDCHDSHSNGLVLETINETCSDCHAGAMNDTVHISADMTCIDCHMTPRESVITDGVMDINMLTLTGHSMTIDPSVCSDCHGLTHELTQMTSDTRFITQEIAVLENEVIRLEQTATNSLASGLLGGAIGVMILLGLIYVILRVGRVR